MGLPGIDPVQLTGRVPVILLEGRLPVLETPMAQALGLRDGQVVRPNVEVRDGQMMLMLQGTAIAVPPQLQFGDRPWWQVHLDARGRATLTPLASAPAGEGGGQAPSAASALGATASRLEQLALRPPTSPGAGLQALLQPGVLQAMLQSVPSTELGAQLARAIQAWPQAGQVTADTLRRLVRQVAGGPEAALARGEPPVVDLKSLLRAWLDAGSTTTDPVRALLRDAVDDLEARQLHTALSMADSRQMVLSMVLPFAYADPVEIRWSQDRQTDADGRRAPWVVDLHTRSSVFGEVWLRTRISESTRVDLVMWAEQADLAARARAASSSLARWLGEAGLQMTGLQVIHGSKPAIDTQAPVAGVSGQLVDVRA